MNQASIRFSLASIYGAGALSRLMTEGSGDCIVARRPKLYGKVESNKLGRGIMTPATVESVGVDFQALRVAREVKRLVFYGRILRACQERFQERMQNETYREATMGDGS